MKIQNIVIAGVVIIVLLGVAYGISLMRPVMSETPDTASEQKIDINAVCDGALAYMTFTDAVSAELFLSECKEGNHPEVIEKYKVDMGLGAGVAI